MSDHISTHRDDEDPIIGDAPPQARVLFSNGVYDVLKWVARVVLPAMALFYITIAPLWDLPKQEEVVGTIVAFDLLLGTLLGITSRQYQNSDNRFDGQILVSPNADNEDHTDVRVMLDPSAVADKDEVTVKIRRT